MYPPQSVTAWGPAALQAVWMLSVWLPLNVRKNDQTLVICWIVGLLAGEGFELEANVRGYDETIAGLQSCKLISQPSG